MNAYVKLGASLLSGLLFYGILTLGVWYKWWLPDTLLTAVYSGMAAAGVTGSVHYGARYLTYTRPETPPTPVSEPVKEVAPESSAAEVPAPAQPA